MDPIELISWGDAGRYVLTFASAIGIAGTLTGTNYYFLTKYAKMKDNSEKREKESGLSKTLKEK